ncbi:hypothetical protein R9C00_14975 [Flammeovirgaceae bacterium SG7u.111]|nr:hypothetical protein [Flammeovirgaceae bacterium SG7u.132]WPO33004.1 hypothetical protein R9C00_14975 [Flammeovirgaceae bacterium SG7u.111]
MKLYFTLASLLLLSLSACDKLQNTKPTVQKEHKLSEETKTICLWEELSVRESPSAKSKYLTSIYLGEAVTSWGESVLDTNSQRERLYTKIRLTDGTEGWSQDDFLAVDATPGVILNDATIYKRPDLLTSTQTAFDRMDFVAIREEKGEWVKVKGKRKEDQWFTTGWVKSTNLSTDLTDISFAVLVNRALSENDKEVREEKIETILGNTDLKPAVFYQDFTGQVYEEVEEVETGDVGIGE